MSTFFSFLCQDPCFTAGKQSGVGTCQLTHGRRKTTIVASIVYVGDWGQVHDGTGRSGGARDSLSQSFPATYLGGNTFF
jgi:hypothetical protein